MALISRPSIPEIIFERIKSDYVEIAFNFFQDGVALNITGRAFRLRFFAGGITVLDKPVTSIGTSRITYSLTDADKLELSLGQHPIRLVEILTGGLERTMLAGTLQWSVEKGRATGLTFAPEITVNLLTATNELMISLGVQDLGSSSSAISAAAAQASAQLATTLATQIAEDAENLRQYSLDIDADRAAAESAATRSENAANSALTGKKPQGGWNASTNTPNLAALTLNNTTDIGKQWECILAGSATLGGFSGWGVGDNAWWNGSAWVRVPASNLALQKVLAIEPKVAGIPEVITVAPGAYISYVKDKVTGRSSVGRDPDGRFWGGKINLDDTPFPVHWEDEINFDDIPKSSLAQEVQDVLPENFATNQYSNLSYKPYFKDKTTGKSAVGRDPDGRFFGGVINLDYTPFPDPWKTVVGSVHQHTGARGVLLGNSIAHQFQPYSYIDQVATKLGMTWLNHAISGSYIVFNSVNRKLGLSGDYAEILAAGGSQNYSWENRVKPYLTGTNKIKILMIEHTQNDQPTLVDDVSIGDNDTIDKSKFLGSYRYIAKSCKAIHPKLLVVPATTPNAWVYGGRDPSVIATRLMLQRASKAMREWAIYNGYPLCDMMANLNIDEWSVVYWTTDALHENQEAADRTADFVANFIKNNVV